MVHITSHKLKNMIINIGGKPTHCPITGGINSPCQNAVINTSAIIHCIIIAV